MEERKLQENNNKAIAEYFVCSQGAIQNALVKQFSLMAEDKEHQRIGQLLLNMGTISQEDLDNALQRQRVDRLSECPVFSTLSTTELNALSKNFREVSVAPFTEFIMEGDDDPTMYVLSRGSAEVYHIDIDGNKTVFATLAPGDPIGEMAYFSGGRRTATVRALERCELICANYKDMTFYFEHAPNVAHAFMKLVNSRRLELEQKKK